MNVQPLEQRQNDILNLEDHSMENFNLGAVKSDSVYRKMRSEAFAKNDRHVDDILDVILMQKDHSNYIKFAGIPLHVYMYSREQITLLNSLKKGVLHLDATGSIIRKPNKSDTKVYYYAGVVQIPQSARVCAVLEMISGEHDAGSIGS